MVDFKTSHFVQLNVIVWLERSVVWALNLKAITPDLSDIWILECICIL